MASTTTGSIIQGAAGAPLTVTVRDNSSLVGDSIENAFVLAVTLTNALPATLAAAAHYDGGTQLPGADPFWDTSTYADNEENSGGVQSRQVQTAHLAVLKRLDANYVAGRYAWVLGFDSAPVSGASVPDRHIGPYLIR